MAKVYQFLKENPPWFCTRYIARQLEYHDPTCVLPVLTRMQEAGLVLRKNAGKGYCWALAQNPLAEVVFRFAAAADQQNNRIAR